MLIFKQRRSFLVSSYALVHTITLTIITLVLLINVVPQSLAHIILTASHLRYDEIEKTMCRELDDGFGWDEHWFDQCRSSFRTLSSSLAWIGLVMMAAQWWAVISVWSWAIRLRRKDADRSDGHVDVERAEQEDRQWLRTSQGCKK